MRFKWMMSVLLLGLWVLGSGASGEVESVQRAGEWKHQGDVARASKQWDAAYLSYARVAFTFPGTRHGRVGGRLARMSGAILLRPKRSSSEETPLSWVEEIIDFLTWP